jgi:hypothetical protein
MGPNTVSFNIRYKLGWLLFFLIFAACLLQPASAHALTTYSTDTFTRTVSGSWGTSDNGGIYTSINGSPSDYAVTGEEATMIANGPGQSRVMYIPASTMLDAETKFKVKVNKLATGNGQFVYILLRRNNTTGNEYRGKIRFIANGSIAINVSKIVSNSERAIGTDTIVPNLTHMVNTYYRVRGQIDGINPTTIKFKIWYDGAPEPDDWQITVTDSETSLQQAGSVGLRAQLAGTYSNAPVTFAFDDYKTADIVPYSDFVTRIDSDLYLKGKQFRPAGVNIFWLGLESENNRILQPSQYRVEDAIETADEMGATLIRTFGAMSVGCNVCIKPSLDNFNESGFEALDYAVKVAGEKGIKLVLPLVDNYQYYHGGKYTFTNWRGVSNEEFFTNPTVIQDYKNYISHILNHTNTYTGVKYKDDPTIMAWETGNELYVGSTYNTNSIRPWTEEIANHIKSIAPNQLVIDGKYGVDRSSLDIPSVDIYSNHYKIISHFVNEAALVKSYNKAYYMGEYDWNGVRNTTDTLQDYVNALEENDVDMASLWSLMGHRDDFGYEPHGDGYTLYFPGTTEEMRTKGEILRQHFHNMKDYNPVGYRSTTAPLVHQPTYNNNSVTLSWRGVVGAAYYKIERSTDGTNWTVVKTDATDSEGLWTDSAITDNTTYHYRMQGFNLANEAGAYSESVSIQIPSKTSLTDAFNRTAENGWGGTESNHTYTLTGTAADFSVTNNEATMKLPSAGASRTAMVEQIVSQNVDAKVKLKTDKTPTGYGHLAYLVSRQVSNKNEYVSKVQLLPNGQVRVWAAKIVNGVETNLSNSITVPNVTYSANTFIGVRTKVNGTNPTTIQIKAWADGQTEPTDWQYTVTDSEGVLQSPGITGLRSYLFSNVTDAPVMFTFDEYEVKEGN